jgi:hypothetical protein
MIKAAFPGFIQEVVTYTYTKVIATIRKLDCIYLSEQKINTATNLAL